MPVTDSRQNSRLVKPATWQKPPPEPPSLLPIYEQRKRDGWSTVLQEYEKQWKEYNKQLSAWAKAQSSSNSSTTSTTTSIWAQWASYQYEENRLTERIGGSSGAFQVEDSYESFTAYRPGVSVEVPAGYVANATFKASTSVVLQGITTLSFRTGDTSWVFVPYDMWNSTDVSVDSVFVWWNRLT